MLKRMSTLGKILSIFCLLNFLYLPAAFAQTRKVKVGFFRYQGYQEITNQQERTGYGYDFLQLLKRYTDWEYIYLGYDKNWAQAQEMLLTGEIDLLTSAQKTPRRLSLYEFSDVDIGSSYAILTTREGNKKLIQGDYATYDGMRVGMLRNNSRNVGLEHFAACTILPIRRYIMTGWMTWWLLYRPVLP